MGYNTPRKRGKSNAVLSDRLRDDLDKLNEQQTKKIMNVWRMLCHCYGNKIEYNFGYEPETKMIMFAIELSEAQIKQLEDNLYKRLRAGNESVPSMAMLEILAELPTEE